MLLNCANAATGDQSCEWYVPPAKPKTKAAAHQRRHLARVQRRLAAAHDLQAPACDLVGDTVSCQAYAARP